MLHCCTIVVISVYLGIGSVASEKDACNDVLTQCSTCNSNGSECEFYLEIGLCLSCDNITCKSFKGVCYLDLNTNGLKPIDLKSGKYTIAEPASCQDVNDRLCGSLNREGLLCSRCKLGYGPAPYSSDMKCFKCNDSHSSRRWLLYLAMELVPSTAFFVVVILFNVRTTAPPYTVFVFISQMFVFLYKIHPFIRLSLNLKANNILLRGILLFISFWNLDFFRDVVPPFCISSRLTDIDVVLLDCISAFYPLLLVVLTLVCIELHARNFRPLVIFWKPFHRCFASCRRNLDHKASVIAAFATFVSLSFSKTLFITILAIIPGSYVVLAHHESPKLRGLCDPTVFGNDSAEYLKMLARTPYFPPLVLVVVLAHLPTLFLLLFPIKAYRRLLFCCFSSKYHAISVFMDTFQGHYKDGTNGTRDYRAASSTSFLLRTLFYAVLCSFRSRIEVPMQSGFSIIVYCLLLTSLFYSIVQPCKKQYMNIIESLVYCLAGLVLMRLGSGFSYYHSRIPGYSTLYLCLLLLVLPSLMIIFKVIAKILMCLGSNMKSHVKGICCQECQMKHKLSEVPDRLEHPSEYEVIP